MSKYRRVWVARSGYAVVKGSTDDEALENTMKLKESDFDWEPVNCDLLSTAEVVETCNENGSPDTVISNCSSENDPNGNNTDYYICYTTNEDRFEVVSGEDALHQRIDELVNEYDLETDEIYVFRASDTI